MRLLLSLGETGQLTFYKSIASRLQSAGHDLHFVCDREEAAVAPEIALVAQETGCKFINFYEVPVSSKPRKRSIFWWGRSNQKIQNMEVFYEALLNRAIDIVKTANPDVLIIGEDGISGCAWMIEAARRHGAGVVVVPYGLSPSCYLVEKDIPEKERRGDLVIVAGALGNVVRKKYPHWIFEAEQGSVIMFPPSHIIAREKLGLGLVNPWSIQGGFADVIAVESDYMMWRYVQLEQIPSKKLASVGSIYCDLLFEAISANPIALAAFQNSTRLTSDKTRVLISLPPSDHAGWGTQCEFSTHLEMCIALNSGLCAIGLDIQVTYSLHPRTLPEDRAALSNAGFIFEPGFIVQQIPLCDVFISFSSSLFRWALAARKMVINYDAYQFGIDDIGSEPGYIYTTMISEVFERVRTCSNDSFLEEDRSKLKSRSAYFGILDGKATAGLTGLLDRYANWNSTGATQRRKSSANGLKRKLNRQS
jgi:hypothetical protein